MYNKGPGSDSGLILESFAITSSFFSLVAVLFVQSSDINIHGGSFLILLSILFLGCIGFVTATAAGILLGWRNAKYVWPSLGMLLLAVVVLHFKF